MPLHNNPYKYIDPDGLVSSNLHNLFVAENPTLLFMNQQSMGFDITSDYSSQINSITNIMTPKDPVGVLFGTIGAITSIGASSTGVGLAPSAMGLLMSLDGIRASWTGSRTSFGSFMEQSANSLGLSQTNIQMSGKLGDFTQNSIGGVKSLVGVLKGAGSIDDAAGATSQLKDISGSIPVYSVTGRIDSAKLSESLDKKDK